MNEGAHNIKKFTFDTEFRDKKVYISDEARARQRHSLTQSEIEALREEAREAGLHDALVKAEEKTSVAVEKAGEHFRKALRSYRTEIDGVREEAMRFGLAVAHKLAGAVLDACPECEVENTLREAIRQAVNVPHIVLRAAPEAVDRLKARIEEIAASEGFGGRISLSADPSAAGGDCRVEWQEGGLERNLETVADAIEEMIARRFAKTHVSSDDNG